LLRPMGASVQGERCLKPALALRVRIARRYNSDFRGYLSRRSLSGSGAAIWSSALLRGIVEGVCGLRFSGFPTDLLRLANATRNTIR